MPTNVLKVGAKPDEYPRFLASLQLINLGLEGISGKLNRRPYLALLRDRKTRGRVSRQITTRYEVIDLLEDAFDVLSHFEVRVGSSPSEESHLQVDCTFRAHFHAKKLTHEFAERFAVGEFRFAIWPFLRETVWDLTGRMAVPPLIVPFSPQLAKTGGIASAVARARASSGSTSGQGRT